MKSRPRAGPQGSVRAWYSRADTALTIRSAPEYKDIKRGFMLTLQTESEQRRKDADDAARLERRRQRGDDIALLGAFLAVLGLMAGAALFAWSGSASDEQVASTTPPPAVSPSY